jgi:sugar phosphate isomerase/epimerase
MKFGVSTACFHGEFDTEKSLEHLGKNGIKDVEIFLETFYEYTDKFGDTLAEIKEKYGMNVYSMHAYVMHYEPQLFKGTQRQLDDAERVYRSILRTGQKLGAKVYVMHGVADVKHTGRFIDYALAAERYIYLDKVAREYGMRLTLENVHWCFYNKPGFLTEINKRGANALCTLDIKQAIQSGYTYMDFLPEMAGHIANVHLTDRDEYNRICAPGKGKIDYRKLISDIKNAGYDGQTMLELYRGNFSDVNDLLRCVEFLNSCAE